MSSKEVIVCNKMAERENPIAEIVQAACEYGSHIMLESDGKRINAKSIMGLMAFNPHKGMKINIIADGEDEQDALNALERFLAG